MKHGLIRIYFYILFVLFFLTGGLASIILCPVYKAAFAPNAKYRDLNPIKIIPHMYVVIWRSLTDRRYNSMYDCKLADPPEASNNPEQVRLSRNWKGAGDNCDGCANTCCVVLGCPLYNSRTERCRSYGSLFFSYFFCGRYPNSKSQISYYNCPKWEPVESAGARCDS